MPKFEPLALGHTATAHGVGQNSVLVILQFLLVILQLKLKLARERIGGSSRAEQREDRDVPKRRGGWFKGRTLTSRSTLTVGTWDRRRRS